MNTALNMSKKITYTSYEADGERIARYVARAWYNDFWAPEIRGSQAEVSFDYLHEIPRFVIELLTAVAGKGERHCEILYRKFGPLGK